MEKHFLKNNSPSLWIIMGVAGSGKSSVGNALAERLELPFVDGDSYHPPENLSKMANGIPLTDEDRLPWLKSLKELLESKKNDKGLVLACSALKQSYRDILQEAGDIHWVVLHGSTSLLQRRLGLRKDHFMKAEMLTSQLETFEPPFIGFFPDIAKPIEEIVADIIQNHHETKQDPQGVESKVDAIELGIIGMGVMGRSLAMNLADKGNSIAIFNRHVAGKEEKIAEKVKGAYSGPGHLLAFDELAPFIQSLSLPRKLLLMVPAGAAVDHLIEELLPLLQPGDLLMDGGNSWYKDTTQRAQKVKKHQIHYLGLGISGGEEGARTGPALMPGGDKKAYESVQESLKAIAAKDYQNQPCLTYIGKDGSGHFVKMIHNSIEYAEMQLIAEFFFLLDQHSGMDRKAISDLFKKWAKTHHASYLLNITVEILDTKEGDEYLLDKVLDVAEQKGTGTWSIHTALESGQPMASLYSALEARYLSGFKKQRQENSKRLRFPLGAIKVNEAFLKNLDQAYGLVRLLNHQIGFSLIQQVSTDQKWNIQVHEVARIWTGGCIIQSKLMEELNQWLKHHPSLWESPAFMDQVRASTPALQDILKEAIGLSAYLPCSFSAYQYLIGMSQMKSSAHLIQAQRDFFGAHQFRRVDKSEKEYFHYQWNKKS